MAAAQKRGRRSTGIQPGGKLSTKAHAVVDGLGNPLRVLLTLGNCNGICYAQKLLEPFGLRGKYIIADKGYDSDRFVRWLEKCGTIVVIPSRKTAKHPRDIDQYIYMERHLVENLFLKFKTHRRFVTRYEKRACLFFAVTLRAAILVWIA